MKPIYSSGSACLFCDATVIFVRHTKKQLLFYICDDCERRMQGHGICGDSDDVEAVDCTSFPDCFGCPQFRTTMDTKFHNKHAKESNKFWEYRPDLT